MHLGGFSVEGKELHGEIEVAFSMFKTVFIFFI